MTTNPTNLIRFIALSDIHLFKSKRFSEHEYLIDEFIKVIRKEKPTVVVIVGDIIDSKVNISAEQVKLARKLFKRIADFVPIITILGNHDLNLENKTRISIIEDVIDSIKEIVKNPIYFYKHSGIYNQFGVNWYVWSCLDDQLNPSKETHYKNHVLSTPVDPEKYKIGLFHGAIKGCIADNGFRLSTGTDISEFDEVDIVVAGDIHMQQNFRNNEINYCGSFIQTKENEDPYGSYLLYEWNEDNKNFYPEVLILENKFSVVVRKLVNLDTEVDFGDSIYPEQLLKITYDKKQFTKPEIIDYRKLIQTKYPNNKVELKPVLQNKNNKIITDKNDDSKQVVKLDFEILLKKFLEKNKEGLNVKDLKEDFKSIMNLDKEYSKFLGTDKDFEEGDFEPEALVINNLYSFGPKKTVIDLTHEGIIGVSGKNRVGKSTLLKIIQFILYNSVPPNTTSFKKIINKYNRDQVAFGEFYFYKNKKRYVIRREVTPNKKKDGVAFDLTFQQIDENGIEIENLTDEKRQNTEVVIQKYCGVEEMFEILSFFSAQKKQIEFVDCKNSKRLELVNKFMGLQEFEQKFESVKSDVRVKNKLFESEVNDFNKNLVISELEESKENNVREILIKSKLIQHKKEKIEEVENELSNLTSKLGKYESILQRKFKTSVEVKSLIETKEKEIEKIENSDTNKDLELEPIKKIINKNNLELEFLEDELKKSEILIENSLKDLTNFFKKTEQKYSTKFDNLDQCFFQQRLDIEKQITTVEIEIKRNHKQLEIDICGTCSKEFNEKDKEKVKKSLMSLNDDLKVLQVKLVDIELKEKEVLECKKQHKILQSLVTEAKESVYYINKSKIEKNQENSDLENELLKIENKYLNLIATINNFKLEIINLKLSVQESLKFELEKEEAEKETIVLKEKINLIRQEKGILTSNILSLNTIVGQLTEANKNIDKQITDYKSKAKIIFDLEEELRLLNIYKNVVAKDGLPLFILKEKIKDINEEINTIANQVFDFDVNFMIDEDSGELSLDFTYDGDHDNCDVSLASGSETFIINLCIKVGLTQISTIPKLKTLVIDEGFGTLDKENIEKIPTLFTSLLNYYKNIILISHLDEVKDVYTHTINLEKTGKYTEIV